MTPERWQQIDKLFEQALEKEPDCRPSFLDEACAGDAELRREVESLLGYEKQGQQLLARPALQVIAGRLAGDSPSLVGQQLGRYQVLSLLGAGGMGEVYKAKDTDLHRAVALKLLPAGFAHDKDRLRRFQREARAVSALNHPNILTLYEIEEVQGTLFIATEFIDGQTLRQRLSAGALQLSELLDIAIQVASALATAHQAGIVHRDIKPENIMLRQDGYVKVLDFGVAKLIEAHRGATSIQPSDMATLYTETGQVMGTVQYMSPEQALGQDVDHRTDLFSLGAILYEMATGRQPFQGATAAAVFDEILHQQPTLPRKLKPDLPEELEKIIRKTLEKDRELRYQTAFDLRADLKRMQRQIESDGVIASQGAKVDSTLSPSPASSRWSILALGAAVIGLAAVGVTWLIWGRTGPPREPTQRQITTNSFETPVSVAAISSDGKNLAFADEDGAYLRLIDTGERHSLGFPPSLKVSYLAWFPDGNRLAACATSGGESLPSLWSVSTLGGTPRKLRDNTLSTSVSPDGTQIVFVSANGNEIWLMEANGGNAHKIITGSKEDIFLRVLWFPDGRRLGYLRQSIVKQQLAIESCDLKGGSASVLFSGSWLSDFL